MVHEAVSGAATAAIWTLFQLSLPILLPALLTGLVVGLVQAATSINENTLTFVPKLLIAIVGLALGGALLMQRLVEFTLSVYDLIPLIGR